MEARLDHDWLHDSFKVWFIQRLTDGAVLVHRHVEGDTWTMDRVEAGAEALPSLTLPATFLEALVAEASDHLPPSAATDRHLTDAITVRDRLLSLVEAGGATMDR